MSEYIDEERLYSGIFSVNAISSNWKKNSIFGIHWKCGLTKIKLWRLWFPFSDDMSKLRHSFKWHEWTHNTQARSHGGIQGQCPPQIICTLLNFLMPRKIRFKHEIKTKTFPQKVLNFASKPQKLATGLITLLDYIKLRWYHPYFEITLRVADQRISLLSWK